MSNAAAGPSRKRKSVPAPKPKKDPVVALALIKAKMAAAGITGEELRADRERFAVRHLERLTDSEEEKHEKILVLLRAYLDKREDGWADRVLKEGGDPLRIEDWKVFIRFCIRLRPVGKGHGPNGAYRVRAIINETNLAVSAWMRLTGNSMPKHERDQLVPYINNVLVDEFSLTSEEPQACHAGSDSESDS